MNLRTLNCSYKSALADPETAKGGNGGGGRISPVDFEEWCRCRIFGHAKKEKNSLVWYPILKYPIVTYVGLLASNYFFSSFSSVQRTKTYINWHYWYTTFRVHGKSYSTKRGCPFWNGGAPTYIRVGGALPDCSLWIHQWKLVLICHPIRVEGWFDLNNCEWILCSRKFRLQKEALLGFELGTLRFRAQCYHYSNMPHTDFASSH